jgi:hypothetical protein
MQKHVFDPITAFLADHGVFIPDAQIDHVFVAQRRNKLLIMNDSGKDIERQFTRSGGQRFSAQIQDNTIVELQRAS